ncbi:MAG: class E sortase [Armatimonadota bacterium]|nr:class E sortase [Armatimonadota bacterium]MDR7452677.1 class E sortase [Armatimonadota bacterium]MDR7466717.1 class E sortase [Armatimonadota bacterium]MDR7492809.1 class E sortase [Armatimonadota bacterium]MDR7498585.1 class E sortase [Armatimonadota bacterium]
MTRPRLLGTLSAVLVAAGIGCIAVPLVWSLHTARSVAPAQAEALAAWEDVVREGLAAEGETSHPAAAASGLRETSRAAPLWLSIPRLRLTRLIPEGASAGHLRRFGAGRISWTSLPDGPGIVGIAGHRTTYGAPFFRLGVLRTGDRIVLAYRGRTYEYTVTQRRIVRPDEVDVLRSATGERMVALVTCTPFYSAKYRLVVFARLQAVSFSPLPP